MVQWLPPALFKSSCSMDVKLFPFDRQVCNITFSSSTYDKRWKQFYLATLTFELRDLVFKLNGDVVVDPGFMESEWHLKYCPASTSVRTTESGEEFSQHTFSLYLERKPLFWILNIIIPIMLMFCLSAGVFYVRKKFLPQIKSLATCWFGRKDDSVNLHSLGSNCFSVFTSAKVSLFNILSVL